MNNSLPYQGPTNPDAYLETSSQVIDGKTVHRQVVEVPGLVDFDKNANITISIVTTGAIKTITETDGVKTRTTVIDATDENNKSIIVTWS